MKEYLRFSLKREGAFLAIWTYALPVVGLLAFLIWWVISYLSE
ncbi:MAG TPA: hypothetical protein VJV05_03650 [Pyrinomonadaceae bacterium]|nr:hypothetical protein [Pyrinomonadaceae bacterium]